MERFVYKAKTKDGKTRQGKVEARDMSTAVAVLRERSLVVVSIHPLNELTGMSSLLKKFQRITSDDVVAFTRQFATMVSSGLPLTEALSVLELQSNPAMARVVGDVLRDVQGGSTIGDALEKHSDVFPNVYVSLIRAGEASGSLQDVLKRLADNMEREKEFRAKIKGAMIYPVIVFVGMIVVGVIMMIFVIPKLAEMYKDFDAELPLATKVLIGISDFVVSFWWIVLILGGAGGYGFFVWRKTTRGREALDQAMLRMPVLGKLKGQVVLAEMARTMSLLISAGITIIEALDITSGVVNNSVYRQGLNSSIKSVKKGIPLSVTLARTGAFPPLLSNMIAVGEETGRMDEVLLKVAQYYEVESEHTVQNLTTALEPLIMIVLGIGVGFLVISIIMPIYNLTSQF